MTFIRTALATSALLLTCVAAPHSHAAPWRYPTKAVRMIVPLAPGGGSDIVGRVVAQALTQDWGKSVVVDNRPGAGSVVGTAIAAKAPADGYTLLFVAAAQSIVMWAALTTVFQRSISDLRYRRNSSGEEV